MSSNPNYYLLVTLGTQNEANLSVYSTVKKLTSYVR